MGDALFHIIALAVAAWGVIRGYRRGLTGMVTSVLGMAFGIVCSHIFCDGATEIVYGLIPVRGDDAGRRFLASNIACGAVFFLVYGVFRSVTGIIRAAMAGAGSGLLNSLLGTFFCVYNYLLMLSVGYNVFVGWNPESEMMRQGKADDGNIVSAVMWIAPAALGSESFADFAHQEQLRQARTISFNNTAPRRVIKEADADSAKYVTVYNNRI